MQLKQEHSTTKKTSPLPVRLWRRQHNGRRLWTAASERRSPFTTVENAARRGWSSVYKRCGL